MMPQPSGDWSVFQQIFAERWDAFRRYLTDFPRLHEAPPATLALWERFLVYGIAFGIADRVLQGAQLHMPEALHEASAIYWISPGGDLVIADGISEPGGTVEMVAEMDVLCVISNCPQVNNPCNGFNPTPVRVVVARGADGGPSSRRPGGL